MCLVSFEVPFKIEVTTCCSFIHFKWRLFSLLLNDFRFFPSQANVFNEDMFLLRDWSKKKLRCSFVRLGSFLHWHQSMLIINEYIFKNLVFIHMHEDKIYRIWLTSLVLMSFSFVKFCFLQWIKSAQKS